MFLTYNSSTLFLPFHQSQQGEPESKPRDEVWVTRQRFDLFSWWRRAKRLERRSRHYPDPCRSASAVSKKNFFCSGWMSSHFLWFHMDDTYYCPLITNAKFLLQKNMIAYMVMVEIYQDCTNSRFSRFGTLRDVTHLDAGTWEGGHRFSRG